MSGIRNNAYVLTGTYYLSFIALGLTSASFGPTLQGLAQNTRSTLALVSYLFVVRSFGYLLGSLQGGRIYDRVKGHPVVSAVLFCMTLIMALVPITRTLYVLGGLLLLLGFAEGMLDVGCNTLLFWLHGDRVPPFMNGLHAFWGLGSTIAPLVVAWILSKTGGITGSYWILAALILLPASLLLVFPSPMSPHKNVNLETRPVVPVLLILTCSIFFLYVGAEVGYGGWIFTYTTSSGISTPTVAANINAAFWAAFAIGRMISIPLAIRLKSNLILWIDLVGTAISLLLILVFPHNSLALWIGSIGTGLCMASIFPTILNDASSRMRMTGKTTSWFFVGASLGGMLIPWLIGQLIEPFGPSAAMLTVLIAMVGAIILFVALNSAQKNALPSPTDSIPESEVK
jgi:FHS family Na+ dependent glucose MFS transporter 1